MNNLMRAWYLGWHAGFAGNPDYPPKHLKALERWAYAAGFYAALDTLWVPEDEEICPWQ